jgi:hypothetical protein
VRIIVDLYQDVCQAVPGLSKLLLSRCLTGIQVLLRRCIVDVVKPIRVNEILAELHSFFVPLGTRNFKETAE